MRISAAVLFLVFLLAMPALGDDADRVQLKFAKDTTFFTTPVTVEGLLDYVAALNSKHGEDVVTHDNAFALMAQLEPQYADEKGKHKLYRQRLFAALGLEVNPEIPRLQLWEEFAKARSIDPEHRDEIFEQGFTRPWSADEFPHLDAWVRANEPVVDLLEASLSREQYYSPQIRVEDDAPAIDVLLPHLKSQRHFAKLLCVRAWREMMAGNDEGVIQTLIQLHRMGKLVSNEPTLIGKLVSISIQAIQTPLIEELANRGVLSSKLSKQYLYAQATTGSIDNLPIAILYTERCLSLDILQRAWANKESGLKLLLELEGNEPTLAGELLFGRIESLCHSTHFDINAALRYLNDQYDQMSDTFEIKDYQAMRDADQAFNAALDDQAPSSLIFELMGLAIAEELPPDWTKRRYSESVAKVFARIMMPALGASMRTQQRNNARRLVEATAIALLGYRDQHGDLPPALDALVPDYFEQVPIDFISGKPLVYRVEADGGALIYSLGHNLIDDGGKDDYTDGDIAIRVRLPQ